MNLNPKQVVAGRYEIIEKIGAGGMANVYRAKDNKLDRDVTFKVLREEHLSNDAFIRRFMVEARAVARLNHPNIVNVYDVGQEEDINYIVMEYIDGVTLKQLIEKKSPFDNVEALGVAIQIASALSHAHKSGIVHRDIKPQNVLVTSAGGVKVTDFGIARSIHAQTTTLTGSTMGSVHYFSPEQARGGYVDDKSDLYSLGIVMYEMVTGMLPYDGDESVAVALMHVNDPLPDMLEYNPRISKSVESVILRLTQKTADARYQSADKLLVDLRMAITKPDMIMGLGKNDGAEDAYPEANGGFSLAKYKVELAAVGTAAVIIVILLLLILPLFKKPETVYAVIPQLVGLTLAEADAKAKNVGLDVETLDERYDENNAEGIVIWQNYDVGKNLLPGDVIGVITSLGTEMIAIPTLVNIELSVAEERAAAFPFTLKIEYMYSDDTAFGLVISQAPVAETLATPGEVVVLTVSKGKEVKKVIVPDLIGLTEAQAKTKLVERGLVVGHINTGYSSRYTAGMVSLQTIVDGKEVLEGTTVGFVVSLGPAPATPSPTPVPTETEPPGGDTGTDDPNAEREIPLRMNWTLPDDEDDCVLTLMKKTSDNFVEVYKEVHSRYDFPVEITVRGTGKVEYHMMINGVDVGSQIVDFSKPDGIPEGL